MKSAWDRRPVLALFLVAAALMPAIQGCESPRYEVHYELGVTPAAVESDAPEDGPKTTAIAADIAWTLTSHSLEALVTNRADTTAVILWEGATISHDGGEPEPLISCSPCPGPDLPQAPTTIPRKGQIAIDTIPGSLGEWEWLSNRAMGGSWHATADIMGVPLSEAGSMEDIEKAALETVGRKLRIRVPIRIGRRLVTHLYELRVSGADVRRAYH
ncbi:MAG: hypothetical protein JXB46_01435 [Candidatus Eisenbacteria bacterium]|nr:hypothetical protein [Candidatus Eisenbacteria bacterium]